MNKAYKTVWNRARRAFMAVAESARGVAKGQAAQPLRPRHALSATGQGSSMVFANSFFLPSKLLKSLSAAVLTLAISLPAMATTFTVDAGGSGNYLTLEALRQANVLQEGDIVVLNNDDATLTATLSGRSLTFTGQGKASPAGAGYPLFYSGGSSQLTLNAATGQALEIKGFHSSDNTGAYGGAIEGNTVTFKAGQQTFTGNQANSDTSAFGGAIDGETVTFTDGTQTFTGNQANGDTYAFGGAIDGNVTFKTGTQTFSDNRATATTERAYGGAISSWSGVTFEAGQQTFTGNQANGNTNAYGGAINGNVTFKTGTQTFSDNRATATMGGAQGGAIDGGTVTFTDGTQTFTGNQANGNTYAQGGAIRSNVTFEAGQQTFTGNQANSNTSAVGGAIRGTVTFTNGTQTFTGNQANGNTHAFSGAIEGNVTFKTGTQTFSDNRATATMGEAQGGAIGGNVTFEGGTQTFSDNHATATTGGAQGGAIDGNVTFEAGQQAFTGNQANSNTSAVGGAIRGTVTFTDGTQTFTGNQANGNTEAYGGAILGDVTFEGGTQTFSNNEAVAASGSAQGGAIYAESSTTVFTGGVQHFSANSADQGGALYQTGWRWDPTDTFRSLTLNGGTQTFTGNVARQAGGALFIEGDALLRAKAGGGHGDITFQGNTAAGLGNALYLDNNKITRYDESYNEEINRRDAPARVVLAAESGRSIFFYDPITSNAAFNDLQVVLHPESTDTGSLVFDGGSWQAQGKTLASDTGFFTSVFYGSVRQEHGVTRLKNGASWVVSDSLSLAGGTLSLADASSVRAAQWVIGVDDRSAVLDLQQSTRTQTLTRLSGNAQGQILLAEGQSLTLDNAAGQESHFAGVISGNAHLEKTGAGTLALTGANTYSGGTLITAGVVEFERANNFGSGQVLINGGGLCWAQGFDTDISAALGAIGVNGASFDTQDNTVRFTAALSGLGAVNKLGSGTLMLDHANNAVDTVNVQGGRLVVGANVGSTAALAAAHGVQVEAGAELAGHGVVVGDVHLAGGTLSPGNSAGVFTVTGQLSGSGTLDLDEVSFTAPAQSDLLRVGETSGSHLVRVGRITGEPAAPKQSMKVIDVTGGLAKSQGVFSLAGGQMDVGAWRYRLLKGDTLASVDDAADWYLFNTAMHSNFASDLQKISSAQLIAFEQSLNAVHQRMGELRLDERAQGDLWVRSWHQRLDNRQYDGYSDGQKFTGLELGADMRFDLSAQRIYVGALLGIGDSDMSLRSGSKFQVNQEHLGLYASWLHEGGTYADITGRYAWQDRDYQFVTNGPGHESGSTRGHGYGLTLEVGQRIDLSRAWYLDPQLELSWVHMGGERFNTNQNSAIEFESGKKSRLRVGLGGGYQAADAAQKFQAFGRLDYLNALHVKADSKLNDTTLSAEKEDGRWLLSGGVHWKSKNTQLYLGVETGIGGGSDLKEKWGINGGVRVGF